MIDKEKSSVIGTFEGKSCDSDVTNNNGMTFSPEVFKKVINSDEYKRAMRNRHYIGYLGHPDDPDCMDFKNACIVMTDMKLLPNGEVDASFDLINTPVGKVVKSFIDAGVKFGISIRGAGDVASDGTVDPDAFIFRGFDLVTFPAFDDCIPTFKEIAASSDLDIQVKRKKITAAIETNVPLIDDLPTLEVIKDQLCEGQPEYEIVTDRIDSLGDTDDVELLKEKIDALTMLYVQSQEKVKNLAQQLAQYQSQACDYEIACSNKIASLKRIANNQMRDLREANDEAILANTKLSNKLKAKNSELSKITAQNKKLSNDLRIAESNNLKYVHKVEANSKIISQKDSEIADLNSKLGKTVADVERLQRSSSNLGADNEELNKRITAAEQLVLDYQKAYANLYANALGVHLENISVTASTSVKQLQSVITASTATSNIPASLDVLDEELSDFPFEDLSDDGDDLVTM